MANFDWADITGISEDKYKNDAFEGELAYYSQDKEVYIDPNIKHLYDQTVTRGAQAARTEKSSKSSIRSLNEHIEIEEEQIRKSSQHLREQYQDIREKRKEHSKSSIFSKKSSDLKKQIKRLVQNYHEGNAEKRRRKARLAESRARLEDKKQEVKTCKETIENARKYQEKIITNVRAQFAVVNKMKAALEHIKSVDINQPGIDGKAVTNFSNILKENTPLKISLTQPITDKSSELMQAYTMFVGTLSDPHKKDLAKLEGKQIAACNDYVKKLQDFFKRFRK